MAFAKLAESPFLKGSDLTQAVIVTIGATREENFKDQQTGKERTVAVIKFYELEKEFILNKTNLTFLLTALGRDERYWINKKIILRPIPGMDNRTKQPIKQIIVEIPQSAPHAAVSPGPAIAADEIPTAWNTDGQPVADPVAGPVIASAAIPDPAEYALPRNAPGPRDTPF